MTPRDKRKWRNRAIDSLSVLALSALVLLAMVQIDGMFRDTLGHQLADEYSRTDFYPPEER